MSDFGSEPAGMPPPAFPPPPSPSPPPAPPPPGYFAYGGRDVASGGSFRTIGGVAKALGILLIIFIPLQLLGVVSLFTLRDKARQLLDGEISENEFDDATQANLGSIAGVLIIPIAVLTIILMYRMASNLRGLGRRDATWKPGWAIGGWFCPPCAIYAVPWLMFRELWKGSDPDVAPDDPSWKSRPVSPLINAWWVLYGLVPLIGLVSLGGLFSRISNVDSEEAAERFDDFLAINVGLALVQAVAAVVFLMMIRQLAERHMRATHER